MTHGKMKGRMEVVPCEIGQEDSVEFRKMSQTKQGTNLGKGIFNKVPSIPGKTGKQRRAENREKKANEEAAKK